MSGSYDRPTGPPTLDPRGARLEPDFHTGPVTGPPTHVSQRPRPSQQHQAPAKATTRARPRRPDHAQANAPIVPAGSVTGRSLTLVITIMCFLACLTAGAVYMMNQSASAWLRDIASEVTVQIEARDRADIDKVVADVASFLSRTTRHCHRQAAERCRFDAIARTMARPDRCAARPADPATGCHRSRPQRSRRARWPARRP